MGSSRTRRRSNGSGPDASPARNDMRTLLRWSVSALVVVAFLPFGSARAQDAPPTDLVFALSEFGSESMDPRLGFPSDKFYKRLLHAPLFGTDRKDSEVAVGDGLAKEWKWSTDG